MKKSETNVTATASTAGTSPFDVEAGKLALARMLPDLLMVNEETRAVVWIDDGFQDVADREWLHVMWLAEGTLTDAVIRSEYGQELNFVINRQMNEEFRFIGATPYHIAHASFEQRLEAFLSVVKPCRP